MALWPWCLMWLVPIWTFNLLIWSRLLLLRHQRRSVASKATSDACPISYVKGGGAVEPKTMAEVTIAPSVSRQLWPTLDCSVSLFEQAWRERSELIVYLYRALPKEYRSRSDDTGIPVLRAVTHYNDNIAKNEREIIAWFEDAERLAMTDRV